MNQLNFPISSLEVAKGMASEVIQLIEPGSGKLLYTGWLRRLKSSGRVIYAGVYSTTHVPEEENLALKSLFRAEEAPPFIYDRWHMPMARSDSIPRDRPLGNRAS